MPRPPTVAVVGSLNMDLRVQTPRLPAPGETLIGTGFSTDSGGKGANQAVAAARMGAAVAMLGRVGRDAHGAALTQALQADGIDTSAVGEDTGAPTGTAIIVLMPDGENSIIVIPGANHRYTPAQVADRSEGLRHAKVVVAQLECPLDTVQAALALAHGAGVCTVLNAAPAQPLDDALLTTVDWLVVNEIEAAMLTGLPTDTPAQIEAAAHALRQRGPSQVVVTLGAAGLLHVGPDGARALPGPRVTAVDTTGAGDTFVGAMAAGLAEGLPITATLTRAQHAAALAVTRLGTQSAMPTRAEVDAFAPAA
ncbi:ribokinase [Sphaerotilus sp.]|uniref:ribokinase n=1 Tax=Sphaerotilus sp. TaxID=2093942 RepID=UPI0034E2EA85